MWVDTDADEAFAERRAQCVRHGLVELVVAQKQLTQCTTQFISALSTISGFSHPALPVFVKCLLLLQAHASSATSLMEGCRALRTSMPDNSEANSSAAENLHKLIAVVNADASQELIKYMGEEQTGYQEDPPQLPGEPSSSIVAPGDMNVSLAKKALAPLTGSEDFKALSAGRSTA